MVAYTQQAKEPYPANPISMQTYVNKTRPNIAIIVDNSDTMATKMTKRNYAGSADKLPRRIDVVKEALLSIIDQNHDKFNISLATINDVAKDLAWKIDPTEPTGFYFSPLSGAAKSTFKEYKSGISPFNYYNSVEVNKKGKALRHYGTASYPELGLSKAQGTFFVGDTVMHEELIPVTSYSPGSTAKKRIGKSLLVPWHDVFASNYHHSNHKSELEIATKSIGLSTSYLQYVYPNLVDYMADKIQYRCQETYFIT